MVAHFRLTFFAAVIVYFIALTEKKLFDSNSSRCQVAAMKPSSSNLNSTLISGKKDEKSIPEGKADEETNHMETQSINESESMLDEGILYKKTLKKS